MTAEPYWEEEWHEAGKEWPEVGDYIQLKTSSQVCPGAIVQEAERYFLGKAGDHVKLAPELPPVVVREYFYQWRKRIIPIEETAEDKELIDAYT